VKREEKDESSDKSPDRRGRDKSLRRKVRTEMWIENTILVSKKWRAQKTRARLAFLGLVVSLAGIQAGAPVARAQSEIEADPVAFALRGYSVHVGKVIQGENRLQVGTFGYEMPKFYGGNQQFTRRGNGVTIKYDRFLDGRTKGLFIGADADFTRTRYTLDATKERTYRNDFTIGPRIGYRFEIGSHLYITPWFACGYVFNSGTPVILSNQKFDRSSFGFFPTVHIGWRFKSLRHGARSTEGTSALQQ
jgi:hypothetical protein